MGGGLELVGIAAAVAAVAGVVVLLARASGLRRAGRAGADRARLEAANAGDAAQERAHAAFRRARGGMVDRARDRLRRDDSGGRR